MKMAELPEVSANSPTSGRPALELDTVEVNKLVTMGFTKTKIANILGVRRKTLYNKTSRQSDIAPKYVDITDSQLDDKIMSIKQSHPNDGEVMMRGHLLHEGVRVPRSRIRASIHRVDPAGVVEILKEE